MNNFNCQPLIPTATATVVEGATVTITAQVPTVAPNFSQCLAFAMPTPASPTTGQEVVSLVWGGTTAQIVDNCGRTIPAQMLSCDSCHKYLVQFGLAGTTPVFYARRGFKCRRTTTVAPTP